MCYLFVVSYYKPLPPGKTPFAVNKYYIALPKTVVYAAPADNHRIDDAC
jgi:hypothetical protein